MVRPFGRGLLRADCVIDLTAYTLESTRQLVEALRGRVQQFLHCGTIWVHGPGIELPVTEEQPRTPISDSELVRTCLPSLSLIAGNDPFSRR